jgi:hypothetical protein
MALEPGAIARRIFDSRSPGARTVEDTRGGEDPVRGRRVAGGE